MFAGIIYTNIINSLITSSRCYLYIRGILTIVPKPPSSLLTPPKTPGDSIYLTPPPTESLQNPYPHKPGIVEPPDIRFRINFKGARDIKN